MKIDIVFLINSLKNGGPVNMLYSLVKNMNKDKFEITIITFNSCPQISIRDFSDIKCNIFTLNGGSMSQILLDVQGMVDKIKPKIIHSHGGKADYINARLKGEHRTFSTVHCAPDEDFCMKMGAIRGWIKATIFFANLKKIQFPIACSKTVANKIENKRNIKIEHIKNGIDLEKLNVDVMLSRDELSIDENAIVYVFCGYLSKRKNVEYLIEALRRVNRKDINLIIVGDGEQYDRLRIKANEDKRIIFVGKTSSPIMYYKIADIFISASLSEGLPLAVLEAIGVGMPAVLSDIESHREIMECDNNVVKLFDLNNINELIKIFEDSRADKCKDKKSQNIVESYLNAGRMAKEYENKYIESLKI